MFPHEVLEHALKGQRQRVAYWMKLRSVNTINRWCRDPFAGDGELSPLHKLIEIVRCLQHEGEGTAAESILRYACEQLGYAPPVRIPKYSPKVINELSSILREDAESIQALANIIEEGLTLPLAIRAHKELGDSIQVRSQVHRSLQGFIADEEARTVSDDDEPIAFPSKRKVQR